MRNQFIIHIKDEDFFEMVQESIAKRFTKREGYVVGVAALMTPDGEPGFQITMNGIPESLEKVVGGE